LPFDCEKALESRLLLVRGTLRRCLRESQTGEALEETGGPIQQREARDPEIRDRLEVPPLRKRLPSRFEPGLTEIAFLPEARRSVKQKNGQENHFEEVHRVSRRRLPKPQSARKNRARGSL
jgi:hypothetical protein